MGTLLSRRYEVVFDVGVRDVDMCIVDGVELRRHWDRLSAYRQAQEPLPLPVLVLTERRDVGLMTREVWRVADDVIVRPVERMELEVRVETLLRARRLARRLESVSALYEHEQRITHRLQEAALPRALPEMPGLVFDAFYRAGADDAQIGGDWYDALRLPDGRVVVSVGDVSGSGLDAAVTMAKVRQVLRGVAQVHPDPGLMLDAADRTLQADDPERIVTAFVAVLDPVTSLLTFASAGHPRPLLRRSDGTLTELRADGLPLGAPGRGNRTAEVSEMPCDGMLVLYTDGLTEATRDPLEGESRLRNALQDTAVLNAANVAHAIHDAVIADVPRDDVAVFTMRRSTDAQSEGAFVRRSFRSDDAAAAREARHAISEALQQHGFSADALGAAEVVLAELQGNVVRYASGPTEVALDRCGAAPVLHVLDRGRGFRHLPRLPADLLSERGRGLYIVSALTEEFTVTRRPDGGSHARAVLCANVAALSPLDAFVAFGDLDTIAPLS